MRDRERPGPSENQASDKAEGGKWMEQSLQVPDDKMPQRIT